MICKETWRQIPGFPYDASDHGRVRRREIENRRSRAGLMLKQQLNQDGYLYVWLYPENGGKRRRAKVAALVLEAFVGPRPSGAVTRHLSGVRINNKLGNLCWGTSQENADDRTVHCTQPRGERQGLAKLTNDQAKNILRWAQDIKGDGKRLPNGWLANVAGQYGMTRDAMASFLNRGGYCRDM